MQFYEIHVLTHSTVLCSQNLESWLTGVQNIFVTSLHEKATLFGYRYMYTSPDQIADEKNFALSFTSYLLLSYSCKHILSSPRSTLDSLQLPTFPVKRCYDF